MILSIKVKLKDGGSYRKAIKDLEELADFLREELAKMGEGE